MSCSSASARCRVWFRRAWLPTCHSIETSPRSSTRPRATRATDSQNIPRAFWHRVSPTFFETMRIPVTAGRTFTDADATPTSSAVIVSDNVAKRFWPNQNPIGKRIKPNGQLQPTNPWLEIVGTVAETKYRGLPSNPTAGSGSLSSCTRSVATAGSDSHGHRSHGRGAGRARSHPSEPADDRALWRDDDDRAGRGQTSASRFTTWVLGLFAAITLVLSVIGIYGVMSYLVTQRTREFGIRLALGATRNDVVASVLRQGVILIAFGTVIGIAVTGGMYRLFSSQLFEVTALDISSALAILSLVAAAVLACLVPAIRATRVDPVISALRN